MASSCKTWISVIFWAVPKEELMKIYGEANILLSVNDLGSPQGLRELADQVDSLVKKGFTAYALVKDGEVFSVKFKMNEEELRPAMDATKRKRSGTSRTKKS